MDNFCRLPSEKPQKSEGKKGPTTKKKGRGKDIISFYTRGGGKEKGKVSPTSPEVMLAIRASQPLRSSSSYSKKGVTVVHLHLAVRLLIYTERKGGEKGANSREDRKKRTLAPCNSYSKKKRKGKEEITITSFSTGTVRKKKAIHPPQTESGEKEGGKFQLGKGSKNTSEIQHTGEKRGRKKGGKK